MKIILDTNVLVSGIFFSGPPYKILKAWRDQKILFIVSMEILDEYRRVAAELGKQFPDINIASILDLLAINSTIVESPPLPEPVCVDPDDDKFVACALAGNTRLIVSGDKHLLDISGYRKIRVMKPRTFVDCHLGK